MPAQPEEQPEGQQEAQEPGGSEGTGPSCSGDQRGEQQAQQPAQQDGAQQHAQQQAQQDGAQQQAQQQAQQGQQPCWYAVLGVHPTASADDIRKAFRKAALQLHPDKAAASNGDGGGDARSSGGAGSAGFLLVQQAWEALQDPQRRAEYDRHRQQAAARQQVPYNDTIELDDMDACEAYGRECYSYPCRCGGRYLLLLDDVHAAGALELGSAGGQSVSLTGLGQRTELGVPCESCSLFVRVLLEGGSC